MIPTLVTRRLNGAQLCYVVHTEPAPSTPVDRPVAGNTTR